MTSDLVIWWTTQDEARVVDAHGIPPWLPQYVEREFRSRLGRSGRGRLWAAWELGDVPVAKFGAGDGQTTALEDHCSMCGGIVLPRAYVPRLAHLPGIVTDFDLVRVA